MGSVGDPYDNALAESVIGLYKTEVIRVQGPWRTIEAGGVELIVVDGVAAVLQAVPVVTMDVDIVHRRTPDNIERLMTVLTKLDAHYWPDPARRKLPPRASDLAGQGHLLLQTTLNSLDLSEMYDGFEGS